MKELTVRENQIFSLCRLGRTYPEIAALLDITVSTVKYHMQKVNAKMDARNAKQAVAMTGSEAVELARIDAMATGEGYLVVSADGSLKRVDPSKISIIPE